MSTPVSVYTEERIARIPGALSAAGGNVTEAARALGVSRGSLSSFLCLHPEIRAAPAPAVAPAAEAPVVLDWTGARPKVSGSEGVERRVVLGDLHVPFHDHRACGAALAVIRALQPRVIVQCGDYFNMGAVSHHPRPFGGPENHSSAQRQGYAFAEAMRKAAPGARIVVLLGNHDQWAEEYEDAHPEHAGLFAARHLGFERLGIEVVPRAAQPYVIGPVAYTHGYGGGEHYAKKYAIDVAPAAGVKYLKAAHHHSVQYFHAKNGCECWGVGWLGKASYSAFDYAKNRDHWQDALLVEDVCGDRVTTTPVMLDHGAAFFGGRLIAA